MLNSRQISEYHPWTYFNGSRLSSRNFYVFLISLSLSPFLSLSLSLSLSHLPLTQVDPGVLYLDVVRVAAQAAQQIRHHQQEPQRSRQDEEGGAVVPALILLAPHGGAAAVLQWTPSNSTGKLDLCAFEARC